MLVLSRKCGQKIRIGDRIVITVTKIDQSSVRIGVEAPADLAVYRDEIVASGEDFVKRGAGATAGPAEDPDAT